MRILSLNQDKGINGSRKKGAAVHLLAIRDAFVEMGHDVVAIDEPDNERLKSRLVRRAGDSKFDLVYERYALGKTYGSVFAKHQGIPHVLEVNAPLAEEAQRWRQASWSDDIKAVEQQVFTEAHHIIAVSQDTKRYSIERGAAASRVSVLANGYDPHIFYPRDRAQCKSQLGIASNSFVVGFHGRLRPWHKFETLVEAIAALRSDGLDLHLLTVGEGDYRNISKSVLTDAEHTHHNWVNVQQLGQLVGAYDILPLMYDPSEPCYFSPLKLYEAMACGAVPLVPDIPTLRQAVNGNHCGYVYGDNQLASGIEKLYLDNERLKTLSQTSIQYAKNHTWQHVAAATLQSITG